MTRRAGLQQRSLAISTLITDPALACITTCCCCRVSMLLVQTYCVHTFTNMATIQLPGAGHRAIDHVVLEGMARVRTWMITCQGTSTRAVAAAVDVLPVICILHPTLTPVPDTLQWKAIADAPLLATFRPRFRYPGSVHDLDNFCPRRGLTGEELSVAKQIEASFGS